MLEYQKINIKEDKLIEKYNIFEEIPIDKNEELFFEVFKNDKIEIEKIVSNGQTSPQNFWYEQENNEYILLLEGFAILEFEDFEVGLKKGDCLNIEAFKKHRVKFTSLDEPTIWFAVFY
ncbi:cupin domain-containing protein [Aliarcobacter vitoriensis]|uniref:cupin n=1 Tax=Aliarcobacter vitoriensis TaxID=2011099 RepID=UPI001F2ED022|nr:cupin [Aliarcobacter vitoriensis]